MTRARLLLAVAAMGVAHSLHMSTIAEGVETPGQLAALRASGYDSIQGYLVSRPTPAGQVPTMLSAAQGLVAASTAQPVVSDQVS